MPRWLHAKCRTDYFGPTQNPNTNCNNIMIGCEKSTFFVIDNQLVGQTMKIWEIQNEKVFIHFYTLIEFVYPAALVSGCVLNHTFGGILRSNLSYILNKRFFKYNKLAGPVAGPYF